MRAACMGVMLLGVAVMAGPARLIRWAGMVMPLVVRLRRG